MNFEVIYQGFLEGIHAMSWLEIIAALFGAISVICSKQNSIWLYPTGLISTGIYVYLLSREQFKLYAEATMNLYYFVMSVYGWYHWARKNDVSTVSVEWTTGKEWVIASLITIVGWGTFYYLLKNFSNSDVPLIDSFVSATACSGMWLLDRKLAGIEYLQSGRHPPPVS
jgi:nicotinamide mononucleotide transporter